MEENADLKPFREELELRLQQGSWPELPLPCKPLDINRRITSFHKLVLEVATEKVPKTKPGSNTRSYLTPAIRSLIKKRNLLRKEVTTRRVEWLQSCREVRNAIEDERQRSWINFIEETEFSTDPSKIWRVFHAVGNTAAPSQPNEALTLGKRLLHSNTKKADAFMAHYARQSRLRFAKEERSINRLAKRLRESPSAHDESCVDFTLKELNKAAKRMRTKGAAGPDKITPAFIKAFGPVARDELLEMFNLSWRQGACPQLWRNATIIPLLKAGKPASEIGSYRPISLTSCIAKIFETLIASRLVHIAESRGLLRSTQCSE